MAPTDLLAIVVAEIERGEVRLTFWGALILFGILFGTCFGG